MVDHWASPSHQPGSPLICRAGRRGFRASAADALKHVPCEEEDRDGDYAGGSELGDLGSCGAMFQPARSSSQRRLLITVPSVRRISAKVLEL
jgi:hypothetical protein